MKVLLLTHSFSPDISPPQRRWAIFAECFAEAGHEMNVVTPYPSGRKFAVQGGGFDDGLVRVFRYRSVPQSKSMFTKVIKHGVDALLSFPLALSVTKPNVVIATVPALPTLLTGFLVSRISGAYFVVDLRDAWPDLLQESQVIRIKWLAPVVTKFLTYFVRHSDLLVTVSKGLATRMKTVGVLNAATISNGVDITKSFTPLEEQPRGDHLRVLYLGNIGRSQGLDLLISAVAAMNEHIELRIVGKGTERENLALLASQLGVEVDFREPVIGDGVMENYAWADTCIVSLRSDWPSFDHTIPSKLYELLLFDRHITGLVKGEAASIIRESSAGEVVEQTVDALSAYLTHLAHNRSLTWTAGCGSTWVKKNASLKHLGQEYVSLISNFVLKNSLE